MLVPMRSHEVFRNLAARHLLAAERWGENAMPDRPEKLLTLLGSVTDALHAVARATWHEYGLARPAALVMRQVDRNPGVTVSGLARRTGLAKSNVSGAVESLVEMGFLERCADPSDQRLGHLYATDKAKAHFHEMWNEALKRLSSVISTLPEEQLDSIIGALETLKATIDKC